MIEKQQHDNCDCDHGFGGGFGFILVLFILLVIIFPCFGSSSTVPVAPVGPVPFGPYC